MTASRRTFLALAGQGGATFAVAATFGDAFTVQTARATEAAACYDPAALPLSQRTRRRSLGYVDMSGDAARRCGHCAFFTGTSDACGTCQMLTGGTVNSTGVCNSFAPRPA